MVSVFYIQEQRREHILQVISERGSNITIMEQKLYRSLALEVEKNVFFIIIYSFLMFSYKLKSVSNGNGYERI